MNLFFLIVIGAVLLQRLAELWIAQRNAAYIREHGGYEAGAEHYKYIVSLHAAFFLSLLLEVLWGQRPLAAYWYLPFGLFLLAQAGRYWCISSLGRFWNTRIMILPDAGRISRGPYRYLRHPNYWIVGIELLTLPLTFSAYATAVLFSLANLWLLVRVRIPAEEQALTQLRETVPQPEKEVTE
ncbi:hypothetical protein LOK74_14270 [Brevibacillus humidisoli]|uniref:isoprenylcysteine carboxyl methyltransferase family protein n=1 Tax=Brevibacillus humidisoli TaxID=2895522 RepID=UPI001E2F589D|nr:isoprenylcysteine carboxylmethyltransferase family protein [Brevibacillus humidisoli]UFJ39235.1 hypothetical protein LOK74_14270 [Brevibacillus humidisoli]